MPRLPWIRIRNRAPAECLAKRRTHFTKHKKKNRRTEERANSEYEIRIQKTRPPSVVAKQFYFFLFLRNSKIYFSKKSVTFCVFEREWYIFWITQITISSQNTFYRIVVIVGLNGPNRNVSQRKLVDWRTTNPGINFCKVKILVNL